MINRVTTQEGLRSLLEAVPAVVVKFTAPSWCAPCRAFAPHYEAAATGLTQRIFLNELRMVEVDLDVANPQLTADYDIQTVPTVILFVNGERVQELESRSAISLVAEITEAIDGHS